jgi:hypothetical protein
MQRKIKKREEGEENEAEEGRNACVGSFPTFFHSEYIRYRRSKKDGKVI